jgi:hypothetical protein
MARLKVELAAIELWDSEYYRTIHDKIADDSFRTRQVRRKELLDEIVHISGPDPRVFRLSFRWLDA